MRDLTRLLLLPASLLHLALPQCLGAQELPWPYNLPRNLKYYPEDEPKVKRGLEVQERLKWQTPTGMRKMRDDPNEKFYMEYWEFDAMQESSRAGQRPGSHAGMNEYLNSSDTCFPLAPIIPHINADKPSRLSLPRQGLVARDFQCPSDTVSCSNIGSDLCCQTGETCVNTSEGVGCCPSGASCGDTVAACDTNAGYTSCPNSGNGGCCLPGAACLDSGCVFYGTQVVSVTLSTSTPPPPATITQTSQAPGSTVIIISAFTQTVSEQGSTVTQTVTAAVTVTVEPSCAAGFFSCPASLGGGCCPNGQGCATDQDCPDLATSTTATAVPPVRPTTSAPTPDITIADTNIPESTQATAGACPPYYYMCQARYLGGCCRVDRNCDTTSCPPTSVSAFVTSSLTIGIGQAPSGQCMTSWQSCAADVGDGCCPPGYACGTNCVAIGGTQTAAKEAPTSNAGTKSTDQGTPVLWMTMMIMIMTLLLSI